MVDKNCKKVSISVPSYKTPLLRKCGTLLIAFVLLVIFPLILLNTFASLAIRGCVKFLAKMFQPRLKKMLNPLGHSFTLEQIYKHPRSSTVFQVTFEGSLSEEECKRVFDKNVLEAKDSNGRLIYPELKQFLVQWCGYYFWKDCDDFELSNLFTVYKSSPTRDSMVNTDEDINDIWNNLMNKPFKPNRPLWEVVIVQNYHSDQTNPGHPQTAFIILFHHSLADGQSWFQLIRSSLFHSIEQPVVPRVAQKQKSSLISRIIHPFKLLYTLADFNCLSFISSSISNDTRDGKMHSNLSGAIPLKALKRIAKDCEVGLTSVFLGGLTLALREFLIKRDGNDKRLHPEAVVMPYPVSNHKAVGLINQMSMNMVYLPLQCVSQSEVLKLCHSQYESNRQLYPIIGGVGGQYATLAGPGITRKILFTNRGFPVTCTNFFMGSDPMYFDSTKKNRCTDIAFNVGSGQGIGAIGLRVLSFEDRIRLGVVVDSAVMSADEAAEFTASIEKHLHALISLTV